MTLPHSPYGPNTSPQMSWLDDTFGAVGAQGVIPCTVTGTNALVLTPFANALSPTGYTVQGIPISVAFVAANTTTGAVTATVAGLQTVTVYTSGGSAPAGANSIIAGDYYQLVFVPSLASGSGGFVINNGTTPVLSFTPIQFGGSGNGIANDSSAVQNAINFATTIGGETFIGPGLSYYVPGGISLPTNAILRGPGVILGAPVSSSGFPTTTITLTGAIGATTPFPNRVPMGTTTVAVPNAFAAGNVLLLANNSAAATSRKEILEIYSANSSAVTFTTATVCNYASGTGILAAPITFAHCLIEDVILENIQFTSTYSRVKYRDVGMINSSFLSISDYQDSLAFSRWDGGLTAGLCNPTESSRDFSISGLFTGGVGVSDNGVVKTMGCQKYKVDAVVTGTTNAGGNMHAFMADTNYSGNPTGYYYLPNMQGTIHVVASDIDGNAAFITNVETSVADTVSQDFMVSGVFGVPGNNSSGGVNIKNASHVVIAGDFGGTTGAGYELGATGGDVQSDISFVGYNGGAGVLNGTNSLIRGLLLTWTPQIFAAGSGAGIAYLSRNGAYEMDGDFVTASFNMTLSSISAINAGNLTLAALPVTISNTSAALGEGGVINYGTSMSGLTSTVTITPLANTVQAGLYMTGPAGVTSLTNVNLTANTTVAGSLRYHA